MARRQPPRSAGRRRAVALTAVGVLVLAALVGVSGMFARGPVQVADATQSPPASPSPSPNGPQRSSSPAATIAQRSTNPPPTPSPAPTPVRRSPAPTATPLATVTPDPDGAPQTAADFNLERPIIRVGFPLRRQTRYHYRDNFLRRRDGAPTDYNHARLAGDGELIRLHDGIDIYAREGAPVVAPFAGKVIDPAKRWKPWNPERYGRTVVIASEEPASMGYVALLVHLDQRWVDVGQRVTRGQVVGVLGATGNADGGDPHLHFELRAPFDIDWSPLGEDRLVDAFNPYPSLRRADPRR